MNSRSLDEYDASVGKILQTTENTGRVVEQLLISARVHVQNPALAESFDLDEVVRNAAESNAMNAIHKGHGFAYKEIKDKYEINGYPRLLGEAVSNLVDNAIRHTPKGTQIVVGLENGNDDGSVSVYVADEGPVFSEAEFCLLRAPFTTGDEDSRGSGLGLSVVDDIAKMHGGYLSVRPGRSGKGKELSITLPASVT